MLVLRAGTIGMRGTYLQRMHGLEVRTASRSGSGDRARLVAACGARHVATTETALAAVAQDVGGFNVVFEAGDAQLMRHARAAAPQGRGVPARH